MMALRIYTGFIHCVTEAYQFHISCSGTVHGVVTKLDREGVSKEWLQIFVRAGEGAAVSSALSPPVLLIPSKGDPDIPWVVVLWIGICLLIVGSLWGERGRGRTGERTREREREGKGWREWQEGWVGGRIDCVQFSLPLTSVSTYLHKETVMS